MEEIIKVDSIDLIYQSAESLTIKKAFKMLFNKNAKRSFLVQYKALNNVSFEIKKGSVYGIIGNNGAGKSTLLRILSGAMSPTSGHIERNYRTINLLALGVGFTREMTGYENIYLNGMLLGFSKKLIDEKIKDIIEYSELGDFIYKPMKTYSSGMVSRLGFSIAINLKPEVLLVDEILSVGDVKFREKSFNSIRKYIEDENTTVVIVSHSIQQIKDLCNYVVWIEKGNLIAKGDTHNILDVYTRVNKEQIQLEQAKEETSEHICVQDHAIELDLSTYKLCMDQPEEVRLFGRIYDNRKQFVLGEDTSLEVTVRRLPNDDLVIYFVVSGKSEINVGLSIDSVKDRLVFDRYYKKPEYDRSLGEVKATGPNGFFDLASGSMIVSKVTHYEDMEHVYENGEKSELKQLISETNHVKLADSRRLEIKVPAQSSKASFFIIMSKSKLFRSFANMKAYMDYYYSSIANNVNINPFFQLPEGTYTKVPYSIEPFSPNAYGYNLANVFPPELVQLFMESNERFYLDLMVNGLLQAYLYKTNSEDVFLTNYTSTWIKKDAGIRAPYFDVNMNSGMVEFLEQFAGYNPLQNRLSPVKSLNDYLCHYVEAGGNVYRKGEGIFLPSYIREDSEGISHGTMRHQCMVARFLLQGYRQQKNNDYAELAKKILFFIQESRDSWINSDTGDLYQYVKLEEGNYLYFGADYTYSTLAKLVSLQETYYSVYAELQKDIEYLIEAKLRYLRGTKYDLFDESAPDAPGERIGIRAEILKTIRRLYGDSKYVDGNW